MRELERTTDRIEAAAWRDMVGAAPDALGLRTERVGGATLLVAPALPVPLFNRAIGFEVGDGITPARLVARFERASVARFMVHGWAESAEAEALEAGGMVAATPPAWIRLAWRDPPVALPECALAIRRVASDEAQSLASVLAEAHGMPPVLVPWIAALVGRRGWRAYGGFDGSTLVAGAMLWLGRQGAWFGLAGTLEHARGRGAQSALLRARVAAARASGARLIIAETWLPAPGLRNPSLTNLRAAGFVEIGVRRNFTMPTKEPLA